MPGNADSILIGLISFIFALKLNSKDRAAFEA
jgi:hypothetical protein